MLEDRRDDGIAAQKIHEQHSHDGVAAKLVQRDDAARCARGSGIDETLFVRMTTERGVRVYYGVSPRASDAISRRGRADSDRSGSGLESAIAGRENAIDRFDRAATLAERLCNRAEGGRSGIPRASTGPRDQFALGGSPTGEIQKKLQGGLTTAGNRRILSHDNRREAQMLAQMLIRHRDSSLIRLSLSV